MWDNVIAAIVSSRGHFKQASPRIGLSYKVLTQILLYGSGLNISEDF